MSYYLYILQNQKNGRFYIGSCENIEKRLTQHNNGRTPSTKPYRPWIVVYTEWYNSNEEAITREKYIKQMKSRTYILSLIDKKDNN